MNARVIIRPAVREDQEAIVRLRTESILETPQATYSRNQALRWAAQDATEALANRILDGCVLVGETGRRLVAFAGLDLDGGAMYGLYVDPEFQRHGIGRRMVTEIERLAIRFGMTRLRVAALTPTIDFFSACHYQPRPGAAMEKNPVLELEALPMEREFPRRQTHYGTRIRRLLRQIGIPEDYGRIHRLPLQPECRELATIGHDIHGREQMLAPEAASAWQGMRHAAHSEGIALQVASAYRSVGYQVSIIERKRQAGQSIGEILRVSAAPGYSEHHSGRALDIATPGSEPLEECFESTAAFEWLTEEAHEHGFRMTYPRNNRHGLAYEPWHWAWVG